MPSRTSDPQLFTVPLAPEVADVMDRAVRSARDNNWCHEFSLIAGKVFGVPANEVVDNEGFNCKGYDVEGFDRDGRDQSGRDREGFNLAGYGRDGFNKDGWDRYGFNAEGLDKDGNDKYKYDRNGWDREGYNNNGWRREARREWYETQATRPAEDFCYDQNYNLRPKPQVEKKTLKETVKDKLGL